MPKLRSFAASLAVLALATSAAAQSSPPPRSSATDAPTPGRPSPAEAGTSAPASDAIPGAQRVMPPPDCPNGTMRTATGDLICR